MALSPEEYISLERTALFRRQAWRAWAVTLAITLAWLLLIILPAIAKSLGHNEIADPLYKFFSYICHQIDSRSFHYGEAQFGVCSRCFGVYFGLLSGTAVYPLWRSVADVEAPPRIWLFLSLLPIAIDWGLTFFGIWENTQASRFITGLILGAACATFIVPAIVEIRRNLSRTG
ncbi:MAG: DUF2085 domain-containing protein [Acidobacteriota bacterium]|nr:MAG: DUF2085 domain-containing protein [Acidobacteriota bacterium]